MKKNSTTLNRKVKRKNWLRQVVEHTEQKTTKRKNWLHQVAHTEQKTTKILLQCMRPSVCNRLTGWKKVVYCRFRPEPRNEERVLSEDVCSLWLCVLWTCRMMFLLERAEGDWYGYKQHSLNTAVKWNILANGTDTKPYLLWVLIQLIFYPPYVKRLEVESW